MSFPNPDNSSGNCCNTTGAPCDCNTLIIGEAGPQGSQGFDGIDGTDGTDGINAFTTLTNSFVQPSLNSSVTVSVANSAWIGLGQIIYISQAGYYTVIGLVSLTSITITLNKPDLVFSGQTVSSNRRISPSSVFAYVDPIINSIDINPSFVSLNPCFRVNGSNELPLIQVDAVLNKVGINVSPASGGSTLTVGGSMEVTGNTLVSSGYIKGARLRIGSQTPAAELTKLLFFTTTTSSVSMNGVGTRARATITTGLSNVVVGDIVNVSYAANPGGSFMSDVQMTAKVTSANTITVFFTNFSSVNYNSVPVDLKIVVSSYTTAG
jgi:hypothetical protein